MRKTYGVAAVALLGLTVPFWDSVGLARQEQQQGGVAEKAGEKLDEVGRAIKQGIVNAEETVRDGLNKTGGTVRESFAKTRESVNAMGLGPRVYGRLHWDRSLNACSRSSVKACSSAAVVKNTLG